MAWSTKRPPDAFTKVENDRLLDLYVGKNWSVYQICKHTGWPYSTVRYRLKKLGVLDGTKHDVRHRRTGGGTNGK